MAKRHPRSTSSVAVGIDAIANYQAFVDADPDLIGRQQKAIPHGLQPARPAWFAACDHRVKESGRTHGREFSPRRVVADNGCSSAQRTVRGDQLQKPATRKESEPPSRPITHPTLHNSGHVTWRLIQPVRRSLNLNCIGVPIIVRWQISQPLVFLTKNSERRNLRTAKEDQLDRHH